MVLLYSISLTGAVLCFTFTALAVGNPHAHVPYDSLSPSQVIGLPPGVEWKRPSHYGIGTLQLIIENADNIFFQGDFTEL